MNNQENQFKQLNRHVRANDLHSNNSFLTQKHKHENVKQSKTHTS